MVALASDDRDHFVAAEAEARRQEQLPPFGKLAAIIVAGPDTDSADRAAQTLSRAAPLLEGVTILGPAPAPMAILRGRHRRRFLVKTGRAVNIQAVLRQWLAAVKLPSNIRLQVDIDPYSFL